jgi:hypothetical protein
VSLRLTLHHPSDKTSQLVDCTVQLANLLHGRRRGSTMRRATKMARECRNVTDRTLAETSLGTPSFPPSPSIDQAAELCRPPLHATC